MTWVRALTVLWCTFFMGTIIFTAAVAWRELRRKRTEQWRRVPRSELYAHRITPRFDAGNKRS